MKNIQIILVDDNLIFRECLKELLTQVYKCEVVAEACTGQEFLSLPRNIYFDVILMDLAMPELDGFEATKNFLIENSRAKIIAITNHNENAYLLKLIQTGFKGCVFKNNLFDDIETAINSVIKGDLWFPKDIILDY